MAVDWIKMRTDLYRDPKVCMMADFLADPEGELGRFVNQNCRRDMTVTRNVTRNAVVGALLSVWGVARHRGKIDGCDLFLRGATLAVVDDLADLPGFGDAMASIGWAVQEKKGVVFPRFFEEFNVMPEKDHLEKNAERQRRFREKQRVNSNGNRNVTVTLQNNDREEKSREREEYISASADTPIVPTDDGKEKTKPARKKKPAATSDPLFERFWAAFPSGRKSGKADTAKAWAEAIAAGADPEAIIAAAAEYAASPVGQGEYVKGPATWLRKGCWDDDRAAWQRRENGHAGPTREELRRKRNIELATGVPQA